MAHLPFIPIEIWLHIFTYLPSYDFTNIRCASKSWNEFISSVLIRDYKKVIAKLLEEYTHSHTKYLQQKSELLPQLNHYLVFLNDISANDVHEAVWYTNPPSELQTVCECLCLLHEPADSAYIKTSTMRMTWATVKKTMMKYEFKQWTHNLKTSVRRIPSINARKVEDIIISDSHITYERLRDVSMAGYKLLIYVAACLQHCSISSNLEEFNSAQEDLSEKLNRAKTYFSMITNYQHFP